ncbi:hypothetical protein EOPP23_19085 [Endozoicomonas sp. OPT23]|uniref:Calx-beta domain-containing protein n=1 Tax=Endozoicomonas sp. OPT23 TaxID=2072845 RepID=UPI00129BFBF9|nr:Calx-beta domain-containing protein [Endozoicomonas sp. OPT23]MRI35078.1 hypothetical protein [Endozoicomonas sp. OPT23]
MKSIIEASYGEVVSVSDTATGIDSKGVQRQLKVGDRVSSGELVRTGENGLLTLRFDGQQAVSLENNQQLLVSSDIENASLTSEIQQVADEAQNRPVDSSTSEDKIQEPLNHQNRGASEVTDSSIKAQLRTVTQSSGFDVQKAIDLSGLKGNPEAGFETDTFGFNPLEFEDDVVLPAIGSSLFLNPAATRFLPEFRPQSSEQDESIHFGIRSTASISEDLQETATFTLDMAGGPLSVGNTASVVLTPGGTATSGSDYDDFMAAVSASAVATAGVGFDENSNTLTFDSRFTGTTFSFAVQASNDQMVEGDETIVASLSDAQINQGSAGLVSGSDSTTTVITEQDASVRFGIRSTASISEDRQETATFTLDITGTPLAADNAASVVLTPGGTATSGSDYDDFMAAVSASAVATAGVRFDKDSGTLTFDSGFTGTTFSFEVQASNDQMVEGEETIVASLSRAQIDQGSAEIVMAAAKTIITETDVITFRLSGDASVNEGGVSQYTIDTLGYLKSGETVSLVISVKDISTTSGALPTGDYSDFLRSVNDAAELRNDVSFDQDTRTLTFTGSGTQPSAFLFQLRAVDDTLVENTESYSVSISSSAGSVRTAIDSQSNHIETSILDNDRPSAQDDAAVVHESVLPTGSKQQEGTFDNHLEEGQIPGAGTALATGNLLANDSLGQTVTSIVVNGITHSLSSGSAAINTMYGTLSVNADGAYRYELIAPADHSSGAVEEVFRYTTNQGLSANLNLSIQDDRPVAVSYSSHIPTAIEPAYRIVLTLDMSSSMISGNNNGVVDVGNGSTVTRLELAKAGLSDMMETFFERSTNVEVTLVTFNGANDPRIYNNAPVNGLYYQTYNPEAPLSLPSYQPATSIAEIKEVINSLTSDQTAGHTSYTDGLSTAKRVMDQFLAEDGGRDNAEYISYFLSDGAPIRDPDPGLAVSTWRDYTARNDIASYAIGVGSSISDAGYLNTIHNVDVLGSGGDANAIIIENENNLSNELKSTVPASVGGNIVSGSLSESAQFGADNGEVHSVIFSLGAPGNTTNVTFTSNGSSITSSHPELVDSTNGSILVLDNSNGFGYWGRIIINFKTGQYSLYLDSQRSIGESFRFSYTLKDSDGGETDPATISLNVVDSVPVANDDTDTLFPGQESFDGNVISGINTDGGLAAIDKATPFSIQGVGVDRPLDDARITQVSWKSVSYDLTNSDHPDVSFDATTGIYTLDTLSDGSRLIFNSTGYYQYQPLKTIAVNTSEDIINIDFNTADNQSALADAGILFSSESGPVTYSNGRVGINNADGGGRDDRIEGFESLVIDFSRDLYVDGVANISLDLGVENDKRSLRVTLYRADNTRLGEVFVGGGIGSSSVVAPEFKIPEEFTNVSRVTITAGSSEQANALGLFTGISFKAVTPGIQPGEQAIAQEKITYTLEDLQGAKDTATLTLTAVQNVIIGTVESDLLDGTSGRVLNGSSVNDYISGLAGDDQLEGNQGHDILIGNSGEDRLAGEQGNDQLMGGDDSDTFVFRLTDLDDNNTVQIDRILDFSLGNPVSSAGDILDISELVSDISSDNLTLDSLLANGFSSELDESKQLLKLKFTAATDESPEDTLYIHLENVSGWADQNNDSVVDSTDALLQLIANGQVVV